MRNTAFSNQAREQQLGWRKRQPDLPKENGTQNGVEYDHILPEDKWMLGVWEDIRDQLQCYLNSSGIQANTGKHNLKSSWTQCANIFFPFRVNPAAKRMLASFLTKELGLKVETVDSIEFEYAAEGKLSPRQLLGEEKGMRGSGQTSPDVAINFTCENGKCGIYLVENKYTEHHFYGCSAASKTLSKGHAQRGLSPNPNSARCTDIATLLSDVDTNCHQLTWGRQYWRILKDCRSEAMIKLACCPAMTDGYQLLRQQALAQGILNAGLFDYVISGVAYDERNIELLGCLKRTGIDDFRVEWSKLFTSGVSFHSFSHQALVTWVTRSRVDYVKKWEGYVSDRYGY